MSLPTNQPRSTRLQSQSTDVCAKCKKNKDDSGWIQCDICESWFHGNCSGVPAAALQFMQDKHILFKCDFCLKNKDKPKINNVEKAVLNCLEKSVPEIIQKQFDRLINLPGLKSENSNNVNPNNVNPNLCMIVNGVPEHKGSFFEQVKSDSEHIHKIFEHIGEPADGNIINVRRLGKFSTELVRPRPILLNLNNEWFMRKALAKSHLLSDYCLPIYLKKFLSSADRAIEKKILAERYRLVTEESLEKKDFKIKNLNLFYKNQLVEIEGVPKRTRIPARVQDSEAVASS